MTRHEDETTTPAGAAAPAGYDVDRAPGMTRKGRVRRTGAGAWWVGAILAALLLAVLLVFIVQNSHPVTIRFFGAEGEISLAVALLFGLVIGVLLVAIPGTARIVQLRRALRKNAAR